MKIFVKPDQTIYDISAMYCGSSEYAIDILIANSKTDAVLFSGEELEIPEELVSQQITSWFTSQGAVIACSPIPLDPVHWIPPAPEPAGEVNVRINGSFYKTIFAPSTLDIPLKNQSGQIVDYVIDGNDVIVNAVSGSWIRPSWWPPRPDSMQSGVYFLIEHIPNTKQYLYWYCNNNTDVYIDNDLYVSIPGGVGTYNTIDSESNGFWFGDRKFSWIHFSCGTNPYISFANNSYTENPNSSKRLNTIEELINLDNCQLYSREDAGMVYSIKKNTISVWFKPGLYLSSAAGLFMNTNLQSIENIPVLRGVLGETFRDSNMPVHTIDVENATNLGYCFYSSTNNRTASIRLVNAGNLTAIGFIAGNNSGIVSFTMDDCSSITNANYAFYYCYGLQYVLLPGLRVSTDLTYCTLMSKSALLALIDSLADMTGEVSPTLSLAGIPDNGDADVLSAAASKNWTITI